MKMAYKEGSMGLALLLGFLLFMILNSVLGLFTPFCIDLGMMGGVNCGTMMGAMQSLSMFAPPGAPGAGDFMVLGLLAGSVMIGMGPLFGTGLTLSVAGILMAAISPLIVGALSGAIARGSPGRGFISGFSSVLMGYYISLVLFFVYLMAMGFGAMIGGLNANMVLPLFGVLLIIPAVVGVLGGVMGAIMSAILASPAAEKSAPASSTTVVQAPAPATAPVVTQGDRTTMSSSGESSPKKAAGSKIKCPACGTENEPGTTFCQSCGTRLKS